MRTHVAGLAILGLCAAVLGADTYLFLSGRYRAVITLTGLFMALVLIVALLIALVPAIANFLLPD